MKMKKISRTESGFFYERKQFFLIVPQSIVVNFDISKIIFLLKLRPLIYFWDRKLFCAAALF